MKRFFASLFLVVLAVTALQAQIRGNSITVTVTPDHKNWTYQVGETATFVVNVLRSGTLIDNAVVDYELGPDMYPDVKKTGVVLKDGTLTVKRKGTAPGFVRLTVTAHVDGNDYKGLCTAGFSPEKLLPVTECPKDFDAFWQKALDDARQTAPLMATKRLLPERCIEGVDVYEVSFQNIRWGARTYGILCVPTKPGKYPAIYKVPGAGCRPYQGDPWLAAKGFIVLEIGIHGVPVTYPQSFYDDLANGPLNNYWSFNLADRDMNYYKRVVVGAVRGVDYIASLPEWNGKGIGVLGSSQGGFLSIATAALDSRVSCYAPVHAAMCDYLASLKGIACGWPHHFYYSLKWARDNQPNTVESKIAGFAKEIEAVKYYDGVNFAKRIKVPGWYSFGYNDDVVAPNSMYATYNVAGGTKELSLYQQTGHFWYQEQYDEWIEWIVNHLK